MLRQFLLLLREMFSISRAVIFLRPPYGQPVDAAPRPRSRLHVASSLGVSGGLLQHFELSCEEGIGGQVLRLGRIVRNSSDLVANDSAALKEFDLLGMEVAIPIMDREVALGVAFFDRRITGEPLVNTELELIYHFLEQLGLALKNTYLHTALNVNHELVTGILRELSSACVVVRADDLSILHANKMAAKLFAPETRADELVFTDLPHALARKIQQVLKTGAAVSAETFTPEHRPDAVYKINILPFERGASGMPVSALLIAEDLTRSEQLRKAELENAQLRQVRHSSETLAKGIGNDLVPMQVGQELMAEELSRKTPRSDVLAAVNTSWRGSIQRINRRVVQWRYLALETLPEGKPVQLKPLIEEAYKEACKHHQSKKDVSFNVETTPKAEVSCDREALKVALTEVVINALQEANPEDPKVGISITRDEADTTHHGVQIEIRDNGAGFTEEATRRAGEPFYGTRIPGMGLGLAVSRKIIEKHRGRLEIVRSPGEKSGVVRISLPAEEASI
jgi:nitrogen fixation/metabolism regulation signal transduction histidine kinase